MIPEAQIPALAELGRHPAWVLLCERFKKDADALRERAMLAKTDDEANKLRAAWNEISAFDPERQRLVLVGIARREAGKSDASFRPSTDGAAGAKS